MNSQATVRLVILFLGATIITTVLGGIVLVLQDRNMPDALIGMGGTALGALGALLARTGTDTQEVHVTNAPDQPVPVDDAGQTNGLLLIVFVVGFILGWLAHNAGLFT